MPAFPPFFVATTIFALLFSQFTASSSSCQVETETLCVNQVNEDGFGDFNNQYAWSMATFKGSVYVATLNARGGLPAMALFFFGRDLPSNGSQIFKGDPNDEDGSSWTWTRVVTDGLNDPANYGVRSFKVIGDYLYGLAANHASGFQVWRTNDGTNWEVVAADGFGEVENTSGRGLTAYKGHIYVGVENRGSGAKIYRRAIEEDGDFVDGSEWEQVVNDGLGNTNNMWFADLIEYNGYLYVGTGNYRQGMELHRTLDGINYEKVFDGGNGNRDDSTAMRMTVFKEKLYIGTMNFNFVTGGASLLVNRDKGNGQNFQTVFNGGHGNRLNAYVWAMQEYRDRLYIGTFNMFGEFDLISCEECDKKTCKFVHETTTGFDNEYQYGIRSMAVYEDKLMIGSATARRDHGCQVYQAQAIESARENAANGEMNEVFIHHVPGGANVEQSAEQQEVSQIAVILSLLGIGALFLCIGVCIGQKVIVRKKTVDVSQV